MRVQARFGDADASALSLTWLVFWLVFLIFSTLVMVHWFLGTRRVTIDWDAKQITVDRGVITRRFSFDMLDRVELRKGSSSYADTVQIILDLHGTRVPLLESRHEPDRTEALKT